MNKQEPKKDPRFKIAEREAWIGIGLVIFNFVWWFGFAYGMGSEPVENYQFIFGLPAWFFYSCVLGLVIMVFLIIVIVKFFFKEVPFDIEEGGETK